MTNGERFEKEIKNWVNSCDDCNNCPAKSYCQGDGTRCAQKFYSWCQEEYTDTIKKCTMQEFANTFNMIVAKDKNDIVYAYSPDAKLIKSKETDRWYPQNNNDDCSIDITIIISDSKEYNWEDIVHPQLI